MFLFHVCAVLTFWICLFCPWGLLPHCGWIDQRCVQPGCCWYSSYCTALLWWHSCVCDNTGYTPQPSDPQNTMIIKPWSPFNNWMNNFWWDKPTCFLHTAQTNFWIIIVIWLLIIFSKHIKPSKFTRSFLKITIVCLISACLGSAQTCPEEQHKW